MIKQKILKILNNISNKKYELSEPIRDKYLDKYNINACGYGIYEDNENLKRQYNSRYCLIIELPKYKRKGKTLTTLLMNPSNTFPSLPDEKSRFDNTVRNLIILADKMKFSTIVVLNSFPVILSKGDEASKYYEENKDIPENKLNNKFVNEVLSKKCNNLLLACGNNVSANLYKKYLEILTLPTINMWTYAPNLTSKNRPRHLSTQSKQNRSYYNNFQENPCLYKIELYNINSLKIIEGCQLHP